MLFRISYFISDQCLKSSVAKHKCFKVTSTCASGNCVSNLCKIYLLDKLFVRFLWKAFVL
ncbi:hypothetical protein NP493_395g03030 [Ridgeia piscesae]|uniref:Uncharacterized protein n=1 Tax=Ridgeia piscesae TaxID=27915 RepID=A0AAD9L332_RIDPI|nr:hypothetical protein NP493_395g03030 [Ridgeia piscesae]